MKKNATRRADISVEDVPAPQAGRSSVLIESRHSLVSAGTESTAVNSNRRDMVVKALRDPDIRQSVVEMVFNDGIVRTADRVQYEMSKWTALGYSGAGIARDVGADVDGIRPGDLVAYGGQGHAEYVRVSRNLCVKVPDGVTSQQAAFVALGSIALQGVRRAEVQVGDTVAVIGLGLVGQLVSQLLLASGAHVIGSDVVASRMELAQQLGLELAVPAGDQLPDEIKRCTDGVGVDRVVICASTSSPQVIEQAVAMSRDRGRIVVVGAVNLDVPRGEFYMKELDLVISRSYGPGRYDPAYEEKGIDYPIGYVRWTEKRNMEEFLRLVQRGKVNTDALVTHEFSVDEADRGYQILMEQPSETLALLLRYDEKTDPPQRVVPVESRRRTTQPSTRGNVAVFGCGGFARQFHLPNLKASPRLNFRTLVTSSGHSAREMAERYGAVRSTTDQDDVWGDPDIDAVMILTRDKSHAALAAAALRAGKHVFCEKPLATTPDECLMLADAARGTNLLCMTGFNRRFAPMLRQLQQIFENRQGPMTLHYRVNAGRLPAESWVYDEAHSAGRIVGEACHFIDLFRWLTGSEPVRVTAAPLGECPSVNRLEDVSATLEFDDGSLATLLYTAQGSPLVGKERLEVFCDGTSALMDDFKQLTIRGSQRVSRKSRHPDKGHAEELQHFGDAVAGEVVPAIAIEDGLIATQACLALLHSARTGTTQPVAEYESMNGKLQ